MTWPIYIDLYLRVFVAVWIGVVKIENGFRLLLKGNLNDKIEMKKKNKKNKKKRF